jgi:uncharacterized membrane protein YjgN (DUF898 family)
MSNPQFEVVLKGVIAGFDPQQAQADFAALFSLDADKAARMFAAPRTVLKKGIDQETADKYIARLATIGVEAVAEVIASAQEPLSLVPIESSEPVAENMQTEPVVVLQKPVTIAKTVPEFDHPAAESDTSVADSSKKQRYQFLFTGSGGEYFKIWIVNLLLTIVTLGIYSAWAKVRNKQYFYGNTHIADATFEYTADPVKILIGRIIAFVIYLGAVFSGHLSPILSIVLSILLLVFLPWIIVSSLRFNARHTSYRNIPFRFSGTVVGALTTFIGWPLLGILSLGLIFPFVWKKQAEYITNNHSYGGEPFKFDVHVKEYYKMLLILIGATVVFFVAFAVLIGGTAALGALGSGGGFDPSVLLAMIPMMIAYIAFYFALGSYVVVTMANIHWNNTKLQNHQFESNWSVLSYLGLILVNTLGILVTLGLFIPFAKVRAAAYKANHTALIVQGDLDGFIAQNLENSNAVGEGVHDIFDIDISL